MKTLENPQKKSDRVAALHHVGGPDLDLPPLTARPLPAPMIDVQRRDAVAPSHDLPRCTALDFAGQDGYATFMAHLEVENAAWFDEFSRIDAGHSHPLEMAEIMVLAPHPFLAGMAYGKMIERMTATRSWYGDARKTNY